MAATGKLCPLIGKGSFCLGETCAWFIKGMERGKGKCTICGIQAAFHSIAYEVRNHR